jgi:hypothetical protein
MGNTYLVNWDGEGSENASEFECDSAEEAYKKFLKEIGLNGGEVNAIVCVWGKDDGDYEEFNAHFKKASKPIAKKPENSSSTNEQLEKIYKVLNHMRWIGLGIGSMLALIFIIPQCTGA